MKISCIASPPRGARACHCQLLKYLNKCTMRQEGEIVVPWETLEARGHTIVNYSILWTNGQCDICGPVRDTKHFCFEINQNSVVSPFQSFIITKLLPTMLNLLYTIYILFEIFEKSNSDSKTWLTRTWPIQLQLCQNDKILPKWPLLQYA